MKNPKKDIFTLTKVKYNIKYNINNTPNINTRMTLMQLDIL